MSSSSMFSLLKRRPRPQSPAPSSNSVSASEPAEHSSELDPPPKMPFHFPSVHSFTNIAHQVRDAMKHYKHEQESEAHQIFRQAGGHQPKGLPQTTNVEEETVPGIEHPGSTGVIYCSDRAMANGFSYASSHTWANLGQGAPEVGPIPDAPNRPTAIDLPTDSLEYAPTTGVKALREAVANLYNETYRQGKASQYTYENVCIVPGGRSGLSRLAAVVGDVYTSYHIPDYTAYDQVLSAFKRLVPVPTVYVLFFEVLSEISFSLLF
ncbi:hypothetical protein D9619_005483 [Psilocybe cf. subviscida]|uniref:Aminotransferase class I/classII domain-containing protein n=1 Tax=Psilocybe cf. subviscida TaxID=2480587 RepID=A0A8H5BVT2_9AGAR|nr:hypothetical protein D9619_005483 [Psilocybe cf. subviscida]